MQKADGFRKAWGDRGMIGKSLLAAALLALGLAAPKAHAVVIYDWVGTCTSGCTGQATAVLTLSDSVTPGSRLDQDDFVSFSYSSSSGSYDIPADAALIGLLGAVSRVGGMGTFVISFSFPAPTFSTGDFFAGSSWDSGSAPDGVDDMGDTFFWTLRASELSAPGPLSLLALGLAGLALAGRRRGRAATGGGRCGAAAPAGEDRP